MFVQGSEYQKYAKPDINYNKDAKNYVSCDQAHPKKVYSLEYGF